jgi:hypothetical protein
MATSSLLYDRILPVCCDALNKCNGVTAEFDEKRDQIRVSVTPHGQKTSNHYNIYLDCAFEDDVDKNDRPMSRDYKTPKKIKDHTQVLDVCLAALAADKEIVESINDLTTDGGSDDCEAIFNFAEEGYLILKIR